MIQTGIISHLLAGILISTIILKAFITSPLKISIMINNTDPNSPREVPDIPQEMPAPGKMPEVESPEVPENTPIPEEDPGSMPEEAPFQPEIPTEVPPSVQ